MSVDDYLISTTYGPMEIGASVPQRFWPDHGSRGLAPLNVTVFNRSKKRLQVILRFLSRPETWWRPATPARRTGSQRLFCR